MAVSPALPLPPVSDDPPSYRDIPPAFYSTVDLPPPPPHDPHYTEWPREESPRDSAYEPAPSWLIPAVVGLIGFVVIIHALIAILLVMGQQGN